MTVVNTYIHTYIPLTLIVNTYCSFISQNWYKPYIFIHVKQNVAIIIQ
jgi:hypothetical protein